jgi:1-acyl-sn-glycerol-3-phosphate acyltransferase
MPAMPPPLADDPASNDPVPHDSAQHDPVPHDLAHATASETTASNHAPEPSPPPQRGIVEVIWGAAATALAVFYTAALAPCAALVSVLGYPHLATPISRLWGWLIVRTSGVTAEIEGLEHLAGLKSYVLVSNHQSFFDIFAICAWMPGEPRFVAKQELGKIPVLGSAMRRSGHIMIDRAKGGQAIRKALKIAREGFSIVVFAEGTRFSDNRVHPFNDGAAWLAIATRQKRAAGAADADGDRTAGRYHGTARRRSRGADTPTRSERARALSHRSVSAPADSRLKAGCASGARPRRADGEKIQTLRSKINSGTWLAIFGSSASTRRP